MNVSNGTLPSSGEIDSSATEAKALQLARQVDGVVEVQNALMVNRDLKQRLQSTQQKLLSLGKQAVSGLPVFCSPCWFSRSSGSLAPGCHTDNASFVHSRRIPSSQVLLGQLTHLALIIVGLVLALLLLDATALIGTILGAAGIIGLAVGFAVRDTVENYLASILLSVRNPFSINDFVNIDGHEGNILRLSSRATILISPDGNHIRIPNAMVFKAVITNYTRNPERRFQFDVGIATEQNLLRRRALATNTLKAVTGVLDEPKPIVLIQDLADAVVLLRIFALGSINAPTISARCAARRSARSSVHSIRGGSSYPGPLDRVRLYRRDDKQNGARVAVSPRSTATPGPFGRGSGPERRPHDRRPGCLCTGRVGRREPAELRLAEGTLGKWHGSHGHRPGLAQQVLSPMSASESGTKLASELLR